MEKITFEAAVGELENITAKLESGDAELADSLKLFERGVELTRFCSKLLDEAQQKIGLLTETADGKMTAKAFVGEEDNA